MIGSDSRDCSKKCLERRHGHHGVLIINVMVTGYTDTVGEHEGGRCVQHNDFENNC